MTIPLDRALVEDVLALLVAIAARTDAPLPPWLVREITSLRQQLKDAIADGAQPPDVARRPFGRGIG